MKLISLNVWCGIKYEPLENFIKHQSKTIDIFCFQEVRNGKYKKQNENLKERENLFNDLKVILPNFTSYFSEMSKGVGLAVFIRNNIKIKKFETTEILSTLEMKNLEKMNGNTYYPRLAQSIRLKNRNLIIHNFHGVPGTNKKDTPERKLQTDRLLKMMKNNNCQIIIGDFNLDIETEAISRLSNNMDNLIEVFNIKTTRNSNYGMYKSLPYADYAFLSKDIKVNNFKVLSDEVSDHLALYLDFV